MRIGDATLARYHCRPVPLLTVANLRHRYGTRTILDGVTFSVEPGEKIGLVGRNGSGKTTLMKALRGDLEPDSGDMQLQRGSRVGYLAQDPDLDPGSTVRDSARSAFAELQTLHDEMESVYEAMATADGDALERLMQRQSNLETAIQAAGGYTVDHRIDAMLHGLGFTDEQFDAQVNTLSGGQKGRLALARLLLEEPDLLMLDEPTNHLDIEGRQWLETFLREEYPGAVLLVSHDRWLLDRVVSRIIEVERGVIREYPGNYEKYVTLRRERQETQERQHAKQRDKIRQEEQFIRKYKAGQRAKQARGRQSKLERFKRDKLVERPIELDVMRLRLPEAPRSGEQVLIAEDVGKSFGDLELFTELTLAIGRGERIGIIGANGCGKSTLIKILLDELAPDSGEVRRGSRVSVGYYRQLHEGIDLSLTVSQYLQSVIVGLDGAAKASEQQARDLAGAFLFSGPEQDKLLSDLSGGERGRAVLAGLVAGAHNLLVLDEPTNHLDIPSAERLEAALHPDGGFTGALLLISHDRALIEATCDRLLVFRPDDAPQHFAGRFSELLEWQATRKAERDAEAAAKAARQRKSGPKGGAKRSKSSDTRDHGRIRDGRKRSAIESMSLDALEKRIEECETRIRTIDETMSEPDVYSDAKRCQALGEERQTILSELEPLEFEWSRRADEEGG